MPKLKALRGSIGIYGRVKANGIVEVDEVDAEKLLKSKRFVRATEDDIALAEKAQEEFLAVNMTGVSPGFAPVAAAKCKGRLATMIESGAISPEKAKELVALQIELSEDELKGAVQSLIDDKGAQLAAREEALSIRESELSAREEAHAGMVATHDAEVERFAAQMADLEAREAALAAPAHAPAATDAEGDATAKDGAKAKASK